MRNLGFKHSIPQQGYRLKMQPTGSVIYDHFFCGWPESKGAISPYTGKPLLRFLSLDSHDPRLEFEFPAIQRIELLYSLTCKISYDDFFYKIIDDRIEILSPIRIESINQEDFMDEPYTDYPISFPKVSFDLIPVEENERKIVRSMNEKHNLELELQYPELSVSYHQIGGEPYFIHVPEVLSCPVCGGDMSFFASIGNNNGLPKGFFNNDYMQVIYQICKQCLVLGAYNLCD